MKLAPLIVILFSLVVLNNYNYPNDLAISDQNDNPASESTFYFPIELFVDSIEWANKTEVKPDSSSVKWFSRDLWFFQEPVLYNYYLNRSIYRLTWLRSFDPAIVLRFENRNGVITLIEKKMTYVEPWKPAPEEELTDSKYSNLLEKSTGQIMVYEPDSLVVEANTIYLST